MTAPELWVPALGDHVRVRRNPMCTWVHNRVTVGAQGTIAEIYGVLLGHKFRVAFEPYLQFTGSENGWIISAVYRREELELLSP